MHLQPMDYDKWRRSAMLAPLELELIGGEEQLCRARTLEQAHHPRVSNANFRPPVDIRKVLGPIRRRAARRLILTPIPTTLPTAIILRRRYRPAAGPSPVWFVELLASPR